MARRPWPHVLLSGAGLALALSLGPGDPAWLFWGAVAVSCIGAATATLIGRARAG